VQSIFGAVWKAPQNIAGIAARPAKAAGSNSSDIDGQKSAGIPLDTIHKSPNVPTEMTQANGACPTVQKGQVSTCMSYSGTIDALIARYTYNPDYTGN
jgi:hypothetical protein